MNGLGGGFLQQLSDPNQLQQGQFQQGQTSFSSSSQSSSSQSSFNQQSQQTFSVNGNIGDFGNQDLSFNTPQVQNFDTQTLQPQVPFQDFGNVPETEFQIQDNVGKQIAQTVR